MSARHPSEFEFRDIIKYSDNIWDQLLELPSPPHAAHVLAIVSARLIHAAQDPEITNEEQARAAAQEMADAILSYWKKGLVL